jgi:hypothetical protein
MSKTVGVCKRVFEFPTAGCLAPEKFLHNLPATAKKELPISTKRTSETPLEARADLASQKALHPLKIRKGDNRKFSPLGILRTVARVVAMNFLILEFSGTYFYRQNTSKKKKVQADAESHR